MRLNEVGSLAVASVRYDRSPSSFGAAVDRLGYIKAMIAELEAHETELKQALADSGLTEVEGDLFRVTVSTMDRVTLDTAAIRETMGETWCARFEKRSQTTVVRCGSRKGQRAAKPSRPQLRAVQSA